MSAAKKRNVFIAGATGYVGSRLAPLLLSRGHTVTALTREQSQHRVPNGCKTVIGDTLDASTYIHLLDGADTFIQLVGVAHPGPSKARQFVDIDLKSGLEAVKAAKAATVAHFIYVSVAHPAPVMRAYIKVRSECERAIQESGLKATILRPWYVLGPGHRWPYALIPFYAIAAALPSSRAAAQRLGLVTLPQMVNALANAVEDPPPQTRIVEVPEIKRC